MSYRKHVALTLGQHWATAVCLWCGWLFIQLGHITYIITFYLLVCRSIRIFFISLVYFHRARFPSLPLPSPPLPSPFPLCFVQFCDHCLFVIVSVIVCVCPLTFIHTLSIYLSFFLSFLTIIIHYSLFLSFFLNFFLSFVIS